MKKYQIKMMLLILIFANLVWANDHLQPFVKIETQNCIDLGGKPISLDDQGAEGCLLGNELIESITLFKCTVKGEMSKAVQKYLARLSEIEGPNDDFLTKGQDYCAEFGGEQISFDQNIKFCLFDDQSSIELFTLLWGGSPEIETPLTNRLQACYEQ